MLSVATGIAGQELKHRVRSGLSSSVEKFGISELATRVEQAKLLAESMGRLKGAFMKAGQLLSIDASDFLPPEAQEILSKLQGQADPVDFSVIVEVLRRELGEAFLQFTSLQEQAAAAASIGQVHRATAFGDSVAIKVQYPGIVESIDSDIAILQKLGSGALALTRRKIDLAETFEELRSILHFEADYERERHYMDTFAALVAPDPRFVVPRSYPALSSKRVLTMSWEEGLSLGAWIKTNPSGEARTAFGKAILDLYCLEFFRWGIVQTDPNLGNFLVRGTFGSVQDPWKIVLLDFGASLEYGVEFRDQYASLLRQVRAGNHARMLEEAIAFELLDPRESAGTRTQFVEMITSAMEPFAPALQPFVFADADYAARSQAVVERFVKSLQFSPPPRRLLFLHRKLGGIFQLLKRLQVVLDLQPYWEQMVEGQVVTDASLPT
jgi:aarF domain-containing kinase